MSDSYLLPVYFVVDAGGAEQVARFGDHLVSVLRRLAGTGPEVRLSMHSFDDEATCHVRMTPPDRVVLPPDPRGAGRTEDARAFGRLLNEIEQDIAEFDRRNLRLDGPLLVVLTDRTGPEFDSMWSHGFGALAERERAVRAVVLRLRGPDWAPQLRYPEQGWARDPWAGLPEALAPAAADWTGSFEPFAVGDPGAAARTVRPLPDPGEWDRRDTVLDGLVLCGEDGEPAVRLRAASVRGLSHRYYGTVRQDEYGFRCTPDRRYLIIAVADGVSSGKLSHKAAVLVSRQGPEMVADELTRVPPEKLDWPVIMGWLSDRIVKLGSQARPELGDDAGFREIAQEMATTAVFAVVDLRPEDGRLPVHVFSVGDSSGWVLRGGVRWEPVGEVKNSGNRIATSATRALPMPVTAGDPAQPTTVGPDDVLVLMTDGIGDPLHDGAGSVGRFLAEAWRRPPEPLAFAAQVDFARRSHDDDRTAVAIWGA